MQSCRSDDEMKGMLPLRLSAALVGAEAALLVAGELRRPLRRSTHNKFVRDGRNAVIGALASLTTALIETPIAAGVAAHAAARGWGLVRRLPLPPVARSIVAVALMDYTMYLWHVGAHRIPALWRFHLVHHVDRDLDASTALRFHVGEMLLSVPYRAAQVALIGVTPRQYAVWQVLFALSIQFHHANLRLSPNVDAFLERFIVTPRLHGIHHAARRDCEDANWSSGLTLWDRLHGTLRDDVAQDEITIGLPGYRSDADARIRTALALPFSRQKDAWTLDWRC